MYFVLDTSDPVLDSRLNQRQPVQGIIVTQAVPERLESI
jgi:hypothetical protein